MSLRFKCILLDHDDTTVESTATIHYPSMIETFRVLGIDRVPPTLEEWFALNVKPGIGAWLAANFTKEQMPMEQKIWRSFTTTRVPDFYPGMLELLREFQKRGGKIVVVSHSEVDIIKMHYDSVGITPDRIYGWTTDETKKKPSPWVVDNIVEEMGIPKDDMVMIDDLTPGKKMAEAAGIACVGVGWAHSIPAIRALMETASHGYFTEVQQLADFLLL